MQGWEGERTGTSLSLSRQAILHPPCCECAAGDDEVGDNKVKRFAVVPFVIGAPDQFNDPIPAR